MATFRIQGGATLSGEIEPQGAKNEALQVICAVLLTEEPVTINKIPDIVDVNKLLDLLASMGVAIEKIGEESYRFQANNVNADYLETEEYKTKASGLRGSIMILGPLLARFGGAKIPKPGGDKIGRRRLDTHFLGFQELGAKFNYNPKDGFYNIDASSLQGKYMLLDEASVTGTANIIMTAVLAKGETVIYNAACEPYLQQLCKMLISMGAKISGVGSNMLTINGVESLAGTTHTLLPDMIEIGSFIGMAALTQSTITIKNAAVEYLGVIPSVFQKIGQRLEIKGNDIIVPAQEEYEIESFIDGSIMTISDAPWPGFTPDLLSIILVMATQAKGTVLVHQKMFESRLFFVDKLIDMGAQIIRAGVSVLLAALSAEGESIIYNVEQIDRGYQHIDKRLQALGAQIERI